MSHRATQNTILWSITIICVATGLWFVVVGNARAFLMVAGLYLVLLLIMHFAFIMMLPKKQRVRPAMPRELRIIRLGALSPAQSQVIEAGSLQDSKEHRGQMHQLFQVERVLSEGVWSADVEICGDEIVAYTKGFQSTYSPALDCSEGHGSGVFIILDDG